MTDFSTETDEVFGGEMDVADVRWTSFSAARQETDWHELKSTLGKGAGGAIAGSPARTDRGRASSLRCVIVWFGFQRSVGGWAGSGLGSFV